MNAATLDAALNVGVVNFTWTGEDTTGFWFAQIPRTDASVATLGGLRTWLLAQTPSGAGVDVNLLLPAIAPSADLELAAKAVNQFGPLSAVFDSA